MGRNKFSQDEINDISKLLRLKNAGNRYKQKLIRHDLRVKYEFNISDFNVQGKAFGEEDLQKAIARGAIQILDDKTIAAMKEKRARDKARDEAAKKTDNTENETTDWKEAKNGKSFQKKKNRKSEIFCLVCLDITNKNKSTLLSIRCFLFYSPLVYQPTLFNA